MARLHPGVYLEEVPSGVNPIEGVSTSTAGFVGKAQMGTVGKAVLLTSFAEFGRSYGTFLTDSALAHAVFQFFNNGGRATYVVRVAGSGAQAAAIVLRDRKTAAPAATLTVRAANAGVWGNDVDIEVVDDATDPDNLFALRVLRDRSAEAPPQPPLLLESHEGLSMNAASANFVEKVVGAGSSTISVEVDAANTLTAGAGSSRSGKLPVGKGAALLLLGAANGGTETAGVVGPPATAGTSRSGDNPSTSPAADRRKLQINLNGDGAREITIAPEAATGADIAASITAAVRALSAISPARQPAYDAFTCTFETPTLPAQPFYLLTSGTQGPGSSVLVTDPPGDAISLPAGTHSLTIEINGDGPHTVSLAGPLTDGAAIALAIRNAVQVITPKRATNAGAFLGFAATYENGAGPGNPSLLLTSGTPNAGSSVRVTNAGTNNVATLLKLGLTNGGREITGGAVLRPALSPVPTTYHLGDAVVGGNVVSVVFGDDGATPNDAEYKAGLTDFDAVRDVNILAVPGISSLDVVASGVNYCTQRMDCFFIGDMGVTDDTVAEARAFVTSLTTKTSYGAVYYPWLRMGDPTGRSAEPLSVPPSGFVAGLYARIDARRGVFKAPAGTEANLGGAVGLTTDTTDTEQDFLNPFGVNVIRAFPAAGLVVWGARTLGTQINAEYRYIPVRRTAIFLEQSIYNGIQYAVFEPNDVGLWASLRLNIGAFMLNQFRAGMFQGSTPTEAFFVKCDPTTTTQQDIDAGVVNILVGFAPLKPAEFVVLKLTQKTAQAGA